MPLFHPTRIPNPVLAFLGILIALSTGVMAAPFDEFWSDQYNPPGVNGSVYRLTSRPEGVFVCGRFVGIGSTELESIGLLSRDGSGYQITPFGDNLFYTTGTVVDFDGKLTVSGGEYDIDGEVVYGVFQWDGSVWSRLGDFPGSSYDLAVFQGQLYSTGGVWNGVTWQMPFVVDYFISRVLVHNGMLYCGGNFNSVNGDPVQNIFAWNGSEILPLGDGFPYVVESMVVQGGDLVVQGNLGMNGGLITRWDGSGWATLLDGGRTAETVGTFNGDLVAGTLWQETPGMNTISHPELMRFDNGQWTKLGDVDARHLVTWDGTLCIGHWSDVVEDAASPGLVIYEDAAFTAPFPDGLGFDKFVRDMTLFDGRIVVAGHYQYGGGIVADDCIIENDTGGGWAPLNNVNMTSIFGFRGFSTIAAGGSDLFGIYLISNDDYSTPRLVSLDQSDPVNPTWNSLGTAWLALDDHLISIGSDLFLLRVFTQGGFYLVDQTNGSLNTVGDLDVNGVVRSACDLDGQPVIGGDWTTLNGAPATGILSFDGNFWNDFGQALPGEVMIVAPAGPGTLAVALDTGSGMQLAISDGGPWQILGGTFDGSVDAMAYQDDRLVVAGNFSRVHTQAQELLGIAVWTGTFWAPVGSGLDRFWSSYYGIDEMISTDHGMFIAGDMLLSGGRSTKGIAVWTGDFSQITAGASAVSDERTVPKPSVLQVAPNPFNPRTVISWNMSSRGFARITIHNVQGGLVRNICAGEMGPGPIQMTWDGQDSDGWEVASGVYFAQLKLEGEVLVKKLTLIR